MEITLDFGDGMVYFLYKDRSFLLKIVEARYDLVEDNILLKYFNINYSLIEATMQAMQFLYKDIR